MRESTSGPSSLRAPSRPTVTLGTVATAGAAFVTRNPLPSGLYFLGILICLLFNGVSLTQSQRDFFYEDISQIDFERLDRAHAQMTFARQEYYRSRGWFFSCNAVCQENKIIFESAQLVYNDLKMEEARIISSAKSKVGIFSELGVKETREAFWERYFQGKSFAQQQTKFDIAFFGFRAMMRDENLMSYIISMLFRVLFNFTIGVLLTLTSFIWSLIGIIRSFGASPIVGSAFFIGAVLATVSFTATWLFVVFVGVCGTAYVTFRLAASSVRIQGSTTGQRRHIN